MMGDLQQEREVYKREIYRTDLTEDQIEFIEDELADIKVHIEMTWDAIHKTNNGQEYNGYDTK